MTEVKKPVLLIILDGFGYAETEKYNAIKAANTPVWDELYQNAPRTFIGTSGMAVGLPEGQMGNSEVGHMTLGAGRVVYQNFTRINKAIEDGDFYTNPVYCDAVDKAQNAGKAVHIMGLMSTGGVHSHDSHIQAMMELAVKRGAEKVYVHAILDGRDTPPRSAVSSLKGIDAKFKALGRGRIASIFGRFYGMDRDNRWDRVQEAYDVMTLGTSDYTAPDAISALEAAYERDENDEFVKPTLIGEPVKVEDGDSIIFMNFRPDRAREITRAFVDADLPGFTRTATPKLAEFVMSTEYAADIKAACAFPPVAMVNSFGEVMAKLGKKQLRIAETEKYAHVTFFFNGGRESEFDGEDRVLVPSPQVETYDLQPEMSAPEVADKLVEAIESQKYDTIICNFANCDMVGHTGIFDAAVKAVEAVDACLEKVFAALKKVDGEALVTADHGNVEEMFDDESGQAHTQHTTYDVPLVYVGSNKVVLNHGGSLADIAPTMLHMMQLEQPAEMNGKVLVEYQA